MSVFSQFGKEKIITAYLLHFSKYINWENEEELKNFNIVIITNQPEKSFYKYIENSQKIKNKTVKVTILDKPDNKILNKAQMVFIATEKNEYFKTVNDIIINKPILLVSENIDIENFIMINLFKNESDRMTFKVNKVNIEKQKLTINEKLLLLGGKEIDIVELYLNTKESLLNLEKQIENYQIKFKKLNDKINISENKIKKQGKIIRNQKEEYSNLKKEIANFENEIFDLKTKYKEQNILIKDKQKSLYVLDDSLKKNKASLKEQINEIEERKIVLKDLQNSINEMDKTISEKDKKLSSQGIVIEKQRFTVYLFGVIIILIVAFVIYMIRANKERMKKNLKLNAQKIKLASSYEEIRTINEDLNVKNENMSLALNELRIAQQQIVQSEKMASIGVLTAGIAHEINNPVNFISSGINSLKKDFDDIFVIINELNKLNFEDTDIIEKLKKINKLKEEYYFNEATEAIPQTIEDILIGIERTTEIINGLRIFSKSGDNDFKLFSINEIIDNSLLMLRNKYKDRISVECNYKNDISNIDCNPGQLIQVFINIINNSIDAIEDKGEIIINTKEIKNKVYVSIKDNGKGMDEETKNRIFDPFFTTKDVGEGTGMGLSIAYGIIEEHFGDIKVKSEIGKGTEFKLIFNKHS